MFQIAFANVIEKQGFGANVPKEWNLAWMRAGVQGRASVVGGGHGRSPSLVTWHAQQPGHAHGNLQFARLSRAQAF